MTPYRIALASVPWPASRDQALANVLDAVGAAGRAGAGSVCFPEGCVPGYRLPDAPLPPPDAAFLEHAWSAVGAAAARARVCVVLGTERLLREKLLLTALVFDATGTRLGFQDKVQIDPSEEGTYAPGTGRQLFHAGPVSFGVSICHEGWRYPETVRWAAHRGAQLVFHPQFHAAQPGAFRPSEFADARNTFHEKALFCRAAENTCYIASVNFASPGSPTTSAVINPDGTLLAYQPYGEPGLLVVDLDLELASGLLAKRYAPERY